MDHLDEMQTLEIDLNLIQEQNTVDRKEDEKNLVLKKREIE